MPLTTDTSPPDTAAAIIRRRWESGLADALDSEDFTQEAWVIYLEHVKDAPSPEGVRRDVWETGRVVTLMTDWCRRWYRRLGKEEATSFQLREEDARIDPQDRNSEQAVQVLDALDTIDALADKLDSPDDVTLVYLFAGGLTSRQVAKELGISIDALWKRMVKVKLLLGRYVS
jgi:RNA polymerase sigma factor (sigma-70 family)